MISLSLFLKEGRPGSFSIWGDLFSNGALMSIVLGVGGRLIPGILGWEEIVSSQRKQYEKRDPFLSVVPKKIWVLVFLYLCSYFLEPVLPPEGFLSLRMAIIWFFAFFFWKIQKFPKERSYLTWGVWLSCWCMVVGALLNVFWVYKYVHSLHAILVGGFSLLTILVSMRVTLAHGPHGRGPEKTSLFIPAFTGPLFLAAITRVTAVLFPRAYLNHLSYASLIWILGLLLWAIFSIPKMLKD
jgi:uncharacterized protein involved in response to NO